MTNSSDFIILILLQTKFEQKGYDVMKRKYPNHVIFRNSNFWLWRMQCHIRNWLYRAYSVGAKQQRSAWRLWRNCKLLTRKCKYLQLRQIADKHFIVIFSNRILFKAIRFTVIPGCIGKHRKAVQRNCKSGTDCLDKAFFLCPHLKKRIVLSAEQFIYSVSSAVKNRFAKFISHSRKCCMSMPTSLLCTAHTAYSPECDRFTYKSLFCVK